MKIDDPIGAYLAAVAWIDLADLLGWFDVAFGLITVREALDRARWRLFVIEYGGRGAP